MLPTKPLENNCPEIKKPLGFGALSESLRGLNAKGRIRAKVYIEKRSNGNQSHHPQQQTSAKRRDCTYYRFFFRSMCNQCYQKGYKRLPLSDKSTAFPTTDWSEIAALTKPLVSTVILFLSPIFVNKLSNLFFCQSNIRT